MAETTTDAPASTGTETPAKTPEYYTVNRVQDGAEIRSQLPLDAAQRECADLNAQARQQIGMTQAVCDHAGVTIRPAVPVFASMFHGEVCRYEVRSASGLVI